MVSIQICDLEKVDQDHMLRRRSIRRLMVFFMACDMAKNLRFISNRFRMVRHRGIHTDTHIHTRTHTHTDTHTYTYRLRYYSKRSKCSNTSTQTETIFKKSNQHVHSPQSTFYSPQFTVHSPQSTVQSLNRSCFT